LAKLKLRASQFGLDTNSALFKTFSNLVAAETIKETVWLSKHVYEVYEIFPGKRKKSDIRDILKDCTTGSISTFNKLKTLGKFVSENPCALAAFTSDKWPTKLGITKIQHYVAKNNKK